MSDGATRIRETPTRQMLITSANERVLPAMADEKATDHGGAVILGSEFIRASKSLLQCENFKGYGYLVREDSDAVRFSGLARMDVASGTAVRVTEEVYKDLPDNERAHFEGDIGDMMIVYVPRDGENGIVDNPHGARFLFKRVGSNSEENAWLLLVHSTRHERREDLYNDLRE